MISFVLLLVFGVVSFSLSMTLIFLASKFDSPPLFMAAMLFTILAIVCGVGAYQEAQKMDEAARAAEVHHP